jgi:LDH2 family malate/lactate/ureidoglycolate dehydrogenase
VKKAPQDLFRLARTALERAGANSRMAEATARHLVRAEAQGLPTHASVDGIEVPDELLAQVEKLCST